jgi:hypothetical protein
MMQDAAHQKKARPFSYFLRSLLNVKPRGTYRSQVENYYVKHTFETDVRVECMWNVCYAIRSSFCMKTVVFAWLAERNRGLMLVGGKKNMTIKYLSWEGQNIWFSQIRKHRSSFCNVH